MKVGKSKATQILEEYIAETKSSEVNKDNTLPQTESI